MKKYKYVRHYKEKIMLDKKMATEYIEKKKALLKLEEEVGMLEDAIKKELLDGNYINSENKKLSSNGIIVSYVNGSIRKSVDSEMLEKKYPKVYSECLVEKESKGYIKLNI